MTLLLNKLQLAKFSKIFAFNTVFDFKSVNSNFYKGSKMVNRYLRVLLVFTLVGVICAQFENIGTYGSGTSYEKTYFIHKGAKVKQFMNTLT